MLAAERERRPFDPNRFEHDVANDIGLRDVAGLLARNAQSSRQTVGKQVMRQAFRSTEQWMETGLGDIVQMMRTAFDVLPPAHRFATADEQAPARFLVPDANYGAPLPERPPTGGFGDAGGPPQLVDPPRRDAGVRRVLAPDFADALHDRGDGVIEVDEHEQLLRDVESIHVLEAEVVRIKGRFRLLEAEVQRVRNVALRFEHRERPFGRRPFDERRYEEERRGALVVRHPGQVAPRDLPPPRRDVAAAAPPPTHVRVRRSTSLVLRGPPTGDDADGRPTTAPARRAEPPQGALLDLRRPEPAFGQFGERRPPTPRPGPPEPPAQASHTGRAPPPRRDSPRLAFTAPAMATATLHPQQIS